MILPSFAAVVFHPVTKTEWNMKLNLCYIHPFLDLLHYTVITNISIISFLKRLISLQEEKVSTYIEFVA